MNNLSMGAWVCTGRGMVCFYEYNDDGMRIMDKDICVCTKAERYNKHHYCLGTGVLIILIERVA